MIDKGENIWAEKLPGVCLLRNPYLIRCFHHQSLGLQYAIEESPRCSNIVVHVEMELCPPSEAEGVLLSRLGIILEPLIVS